MGGAKLGCDWSLRSLRQVHPSPLSGVLALNVLDWPSVLVSGSSDPEMNSVGLGLGAAGAEREESRERRGSWSGKVKELGAGGKEAAPHV